MADFSEMLSLQLLLMMASSLGIVRCDFIVTVNFIDYTNPTGLCAECQTKLGLNGITSADQLVPVCCDQTSPVSMSNCVNTGEERCDTRFRWTLRPFGSSLVTRPRTMANADFPPYLFTDCGLSTSTCPFSEMSTTFGEGELGFLGVAENPLPVPSRDLITWTGSVQFFIESIESSVPNIIDSILVNLDNLQLGADFTNERTYTGYHGFSQMTMSFKVECAPGYCGPDCTTTPINNTGLAACLANGSLVCSNDKLDPTACNSCLDNQLDITTMCTKCVDTNYDPSTNCETCINSNYDTKENCSACVSGYELSTLCTECVRNRDLSTGCRTCSRGWDIATGCTTCLPRRDPTTNCTQCMEPDRYSDPECSVCVIPGGDPQTLCTTCIIAGRDFNNNCSCFGNRDPVENCTTCLPEWDSQFNCSVCVTGRNLSTGCTTCIPGYEGEECLLRGPQPSNEAILNIAYGVVVGALLLVVVVLALAMFIALVCYCKNKKKPVNHKDVETESIAVDTNENSHAGQPLTTEMTVATCALNDDHKDYEMFSGDNDFKDSPSYEEVPGDLAGEPNAAMETHKTPTEMGGALSHDLELMTGGGDSNGHTQESTYDCLARAPSVAAHESSPNTNGTSLSQIGVDAFVGLVTNKFKTALSQDHQSVDAD